MFRMFEQSNKREPAQSCPYHFSWAALAGLLLRWVSGCGLHSCIARKNIIAKFTLAGKRSREVSFPLPPHNDSSRGVSILQAGIKSEGDSNLLPSATNQT